MGTTASSGSHRDSHNWVPTSKKAQSQWAPQGLLWCLPPLWFIVSLGDGWGKQVSLHLAGGETEALREKVICSESHGWIEAELASPSAPCFLSTSKLALGLMWSCLSKNVCSKVRHILPLMSCTSTISLPRNILNKLVQKQTLHTSATCDLGLFPVYSWNRK